MTFLKKSPKLRKFSPGNVVNLVNHFWKVSTHTHSKIHTYTHEHTHTHTHIHTHSPKPGTQEAGSPLAYSEK